MIGVDMATISRFESLIDRLNKLWGTKYATSIECAKHWTLSEAIYKAGGQLPGHTLEFEFKHGEPPTCNRPYHLSLSHEGDTIVAVALRKT